MKKFGVLAAIVAALLVVSACTTVTPTQPTDNDPIPAGVATLDIKPGSVVDGRVNVDYYFILEAANIESGVRAVQFSWVFVNGESGQLIAAVRNGKASIVVSQRYENEGVYGLIASVSKPLPKNEFDVIAADRAIIRIGTVVEREQEILTCDGWQSTNSGGQGGTIDTWNISSVPEGAVFDLTYNMYNIPDLLIVDYPIGYEVLNTGWRGAASYDGRAAYPGGVTSPGQGEVYGVFTKGQDDVFLVTVLGPTSGTLWNYQVRCTVPVE